MKIHRHIVRLSAVIAAASSLGLGLAIPPAHASPCETSPHRELHVSDVTVVEGNPSRSYNWATLLEFKVETFGCLDQATVGFAVAPAPQGYDPVENNDVVDQEPQMVAFINGTLTWSQGDSTTKVVRVYIVKDTTPEGNEAVKLSFGKKSGNVSIPNYFGAHGFILDDDTIIY